VDKIQIKKPLFKKQGGKKNSKPVETYDGKRVVRSELPAKALITIQKPEEEVTMEHTHYEFPTLRYSDAELREFKEIIDKKLVGAREELKNLKDSLDSHTESQVGNKSWNMEEGSDTSEMEYLMNQIARLNKFIRDLEMALVRIENKTYGICRATGKLIDKQRLRIVPHATLSMEAKMTRKSDDIPNTSQAPSAHMGSEGEGFGGEE
jgi:RNA polymerase-binding transcription factor DksA